MDDLPGPVPVPAAPWKPPVRLRALTDTDALRTSIYDNVLTAANSIPPVVGKTHTLRLHSVDYMDPDGATPAEKKRARMAGESLTRRLRGTWELLDNATQQPISTRTGVIAALPKPLDDGTFIDNGTIYTMANQLRLRSGGYTRQKDNGELTTHLNVNQGTGYSHHVQMDPESGVFKVVLGQAEIPLLPLLKTLGMTDAQFQEGLAEDLGHDKARQLVAANLMADRGTALGRLYEKLGKKGLLEDDSKKKSIIDAIRKMELDPEVTQTTLGQPFDKLDAPVYMAAIRKLLRISNGQDKPDERDAMAYQTVMGPEDLFAERLKGTRSSLQGLLKKILWKSVNKGSLDSLPSGALTAPLRSAIMGSGLASPTEGINPLMLLDQRFRITRKGEGGITSNDSIPDEARSVHPSQFGFLDPVVTPESGAAGVDLRLSQHLYKGDDGRIYAPFKNAQTGHLELLSPQDITKYNVAMPGAIQEGRSHAWGMQNGQTKRLRRRDIQYVMPNMETGFAAVSNMVPLKSSMKAQRASMAQRMLTQALPLSQPEAPLVQSGVPDTEDESYERKFANFLGAVRAQREGQVVSATPDEIVIRHADDTETTVPLANHYPLPRKTMWHQTPIVRSGDVIKANQLLAHSNYTDPNGVAALGLNARVAYIPDQGYNFEDAISVSESFAKRASSQHMYQYDQSKDDDIHLGRNKFISIHPTKFPPRVMKAMDDDGIVKPGTTVAEGDPLILAVRNKPLNMNDLHSGRKGGFTDSSTIWEHHTPGIVTDVLKTDKGVNVLVKTIAELKEGDKLSGRYGDKGTISRIIPDSEMPTDNDGRPFEMLLNPLGVITRSNPSQDAEAILGKIAEKTGRPYVVKDFGDIKDMMKYAMDEAHKNGIEPWGSIKDPKYGEIPDVLTGNRFFMKLHHTSESKQQSRDTGGYTMDDMPAKGGPTGAKRMSLLDTTAILSHGATSVIRDAHTVRGQSNTDYWRQVMSGYDPPPPEVHRAQQKFVNSLKASGINVVRDGQRTHLLAMTNKSVEELAGDRELQNADTVDWKDRLKPIKGGLFDDALTGGHHGCFHPSVQIWTEHGQMRIGDIVRERRNVRVWSYDFVAQQFVLKPIVNWFTNQSKEGIGHAAFFAPGRFGATQARFSPSTLWGTRTHGVYTADGNKQNLADATTLLAAQETLSYTQQQLLWGGLLGDSFISPYGFLGICHGKAQHDYALLKYQILKPFVHTLPTEWLDTSGGCSREKIRFKTCAHAIFHAARNECYPAGVKRISRAWLDKIDVIGLTFWLLDDATAYRAKTKNTCYVSISTHSYTAVEIEMLRSWLYVRWGCRSSTQRDNAKYGNRDCGWVIFVAGRYAERLLDLIAPFVPASMQYKLTVIPHTRTCRTCGCNIRLRRRFCDNCLLSQARQQGSSKLPKGVRRRLGGTVAVRQLLANNTVLVEETGQEHWLQRQLTAGAAVAGMLEDTQPGLALHEIPCNYQWKTGRQWERVQTVFDIEVADTHNYVANGILVSNSRWSYIKLHEPLPSPAFEEPICRVLGITHKDFEQILAEKKTIKGKTGSKALYQALDKLNLDTEIARARADIAGGKKTYRDAAIRRLQFLKSAQRVNIHPREWMVDKVPVLPPLFRPVATMGNKNLPLVADPNYLYKEIFDANHAMQKLSGMTSDLGDERLLLYNAHKALTGLGNPTQPKNQERGVKGILKHVFGDSPKFSTIQHKLIGTTTDLVGRGVVIPDPEIGLDEIGIPEKQAWTIYRPFIVRKLVRSGLSPVQAIRDHKLQTDAAKQAMATEMQERPVLMNRAPVLHRFGMMAYWPKIVKGDAIHTNVLLNTDLTMDYDGDAVQVHVPGSKDAVKEAIAKMLPSKNLFAPATFKVHALPSKEYVGGLFTATSLRDDKPVLRFMTKQDAIDAYQRGEIRDGRRIQIMQEED